MRPRVKLCLWCDATFVGTREDFCERVCGDKWRARERKQKRARYEKVMRRLQAGARRFHAERRRAA